MVSFCLWKWADVSDCFEISSKENAVTVVRKCCEQRFLLWIRTPWPFSRSAVALQDAHVTLSDLGSSLSGVGRLSHGPGWRDSFKCWWWEMSFMVVYCNTSKKNLSGCGFSIWFRPTTFTGKGRLTEAQQFQKKNNTHFLDCFVYDLTTAAERHVSPMHLLIPILIIFWQSKNWTPQRRGSFNAIHCIKVDAKMYGSGFWGIFPQTLCMKFNG